MQVKVQILNPDALLRPDMNSTVQFLSDQKPTERPVTGAVVPTAAVKDLNGKKVVFIDYKDRAKAREVKIIATRTTGYLVDGLTGGEDVIVNAPADLKDGDRVKLKGTK